MLLDFHHHSLHKKGIYNLNFREIPKGSSLFSIGFHPKDIENLTPKDWDWLYQNSQLPQCIAVGECGLDALVTASEPFQEEILEKQILWANQLKKPVIIHCVRRFSQILRFKKLAKIPMIIHGFHKKQNIATQLLQHGFYLSFGKAVLYNASLQQTLKNVPLDRLFLETDTQDFNINELYQKVADCKGISPSDLEYIIQNNLKNIQWNG